MAQYEINPRDIQRFLQGVGETNLAGQSRVGPIATGQAYAQQIAGGMPFEQVVAPGLQFSPEAPMGLTQEQLNLIAQGPAPVMPEAPTVGEPVAPSQPTMPFAPVGTPMPTIPALQRKFDMSRIGEPFEPDFDLFLRDIERRELDDILENVEIPSLFDINIPEVPAMPAQPASVTPSIFGFTPPVSEPLVSEPMASQALSMPAMPIFEPIGDEKKAGAPLPFMPGYQGEPQTSQTPQTVNIFGTDVTLGEYGKAPTTKKDSLFGGLSSAVTRPDLPVPEFGFINRPIPSQPVSEPVIPTNLVGLPTFTPPVIRDPRINVEEIVSPIGAGRITPRMPNLFNIV